MKIFVTGGAGFIGSHLIERLLAKGDKVVTVDNYSTGRADNLDAHDSLTVIEGSIADADLMRTTLGDFKPDLVVHTAASYKDPEDWVADAETNVVGTASVMKAMQAADTPRIIYFQTALCYGLKPLEQPITLDHPILPAGSSYSISKTAAEQYIELSGIDYVSLRLANAYGPRNLSGPLPTFFHRLTNGKPCYVADTRRDFIFIDDLVACVLQAVDGAGQGAYHVSSGGDVSIKELFDATIKALRINLEQDVEVRPRDPDDAYSILLDPSRLQEEFGWRVSTSLEDGVSRAIDWYHDHPIEQTYTHLKHEE